jgi:hypothetical protein
MLNVFVFQIVLTIFAPQETKGMNIYTSYFARGKTLKAHKVKMVSIALYPPTNVKCIAMPSLAPTHSILYDKYRTDDRYTHRYKSEVLQKLDPQKVLADLVAIAQGSDIALCCYEKPGDFCHRHIVAEWLKENTGVEIEEYGQSKNVPVVEQTLF